MSSDEEVMYLSDAGVSDEEGAPKSKKSATWKNKSGKWWKEPHIQRLTGRIKDKKVHTSWEQKETRKKEAVAVKELKDQLVNATKDKRRAKAERRKVGEANRLVNERKAEIVQKVKSVHKLKRMKRRMLRTVVKADTGNEGTAGPAFD